MISSATQNREAFLEKLDDVQARFEREGIEHRVIGSLAVHGHLQSAGIDFPDLDFSRKGAYTLDQQVPDIDLIVPREHLATSRQIRNEALRGKQPVKLGLAIPTQTIDYRPEELTSRLQHKSIGIDFPSELFEARKVEYDGRLIKTLGASALLHTFVTAGGIARSKDLPMMRQMIKLAQQDGSDRQSFQPFHDFIHERNTQYPGVRRQSRVVEATFDRLTPTMKNRAIHVALKTADHLKLR